jgi:hypothetical protein
MKFDFKKILGNDYSDFIRNIYPYIPMSKNKNENLQISINSADNDGFYLEFGTGRGHSTINISFTKSIYPKIKIYTFDSFLGLPEDWILLNNNYNPKGKFNENGIIPPYLKILKNVKVIKGWYNKTLPKFIKKHKINKISFLHIDCDLYSSTKYVLDSLTPFFNGRCVIVFDEFCNYEGAEEHEYKAFYEFLNKNIENIKNIEIISTTCISGFSVVSFLIDFK